MCWCLVGSPRNEKQKAKTINQQRQYNGEKKKRNPGRKNKRKYKAKEEEKKRPAYVVDLSQPDHRHVHGVVLPFVRLLLIELIRRVDGRVQLIVREGNG
jgi:hypothetical protein